MLIQGVEILVKCDRFQERRIWDIMETEMHPLTLIQLLNLIIEHMNKITYNMFQNGSEYLLPHGRIGGRQVGRKRPK